MAKKQRVTDAAARKFAAALLHLARKTPGDIDAYLCCAEDSCKLSGTQATLRCHVIRQDLHGNVRVDALVERLSHIVVDYAIPRSRIAEARRAMNTTGSTLAMMSLRDEANELFTPSATSGEGGELMLFWLTENQLGLPQVLCKMPLKTNPNVHYHGVDGIHAQPAADGTLAMVWGEAKFYQRAKKAIDDCFESLTAFVTGPVSGNAAKRDLALLRDNVDLADPRLENSLKEYLRRDNKKNLKLRYKGACLVGFDMLPYPKADHAATLAVLKVAMQASFDDWRDKVNDAIVRHKLQAIEIDMFIVPVPSVQDFRTELRKKLGLD
jgi:hypothetical protein